MHTVDSKPQVIWVGPYLPVKNLRAWRAASPAAIKWQSHLLAALRKSGCNVDLFYYRPDPFWPKGRLAPWASRREAVNFDGFCHELKYINLPGMRSLTFREQILSAFARAKSLNNDALPIVISYNAPGWLQASIRRQRVLGEVKWICIVADGIAPAGADGYVFLSYGYYQRFSCKHKLHLDGGVYPPIALTEFNLLSKTLGKKIFLYSGSLGSWGGVDLLFEALSLLDRSDFELVVTGPYPEPRIRQKMDVDQRVSYLGLLKEPDLMAVYAQADFFVNPRPTRVKFGENNFPSKLLDYMGWGKPILSTWTDGLSPEYLNRLEVFEDNPEHLAKLMTKVLEGSYQRITNLSAGKDWLTHAQRLCTFLQKIEHI